MLVKDPSQPHTERCETQSTVLTIARKSALGGPQGSRITSNLRDLYFKALLFGPQTGWPFEMYCITQAGSNT